MEHKIATIPLNEFNELNGEDLEWFAAKVHEEYDDLYVVAGHEEEIPLVTATIMLMTQEISCTQGSIVRFGDKRHGTKNIVENKQPEGSKAIVVDRLIDSRTEHTFQVLLDFGYEIEKLVILNDTKGTKDSFAKEYNIKIIEVCSK